MTISTTITEHSQNVAAEHSAATLVTNGVLTAPVTNMISSALQHQGQRVEYGVTTAIDGETGTRYTTSATKGHKKGVAPTGIPNRIVANQTTSTVEAIDEPSLAMTGKYSYADFVGIHTHPVSEAHDTGSVGLSANDIRDDVFAGDTVARERTPYDVYRAKAAIVFTNDVSDLPVQPTHAETSDESDDSNWIMNGDVYPEEPLLDSRPTIRPWLHLVERTQTGAAMTRSDATDMHHTTLHMDVSGTPAQRYQQVKNELDACIAELLIPLSP